MNIFIKTSIACSILMFGLGQATADVYSSDQVISHQQFNYDKQQVLSFVGNAQVQQKLIELGVSPADAQLRIANMTQEEINAINQRVDAIVAESLKFAEESPWPDDNEVLKDVYVDANYPFIVD